MPAKIFTVIAAWSPLAVPAVPLKVGLGAAVDAPSARFVRTMFGATVSIVQLNITAGPMLPAASIAFTRNVWAPLASPV